MGPWIFWTGVVVALSFAAMGKTNREKFLKHGISFTGKTDKKS